MSPSTLRDEVKLTRPFRSKAQEAGIAILRTANLLRRPYDALVGREEITLQQYNVLRILRGVRGPLPTMEIAERLVEQAPGITRLVNSLEQRGLLRREQWPGDRRHVLCQITPAGLRLLERLDPDMDSLDDSTTGALTDEEADVLLHLLGRVREASASGR